MATADLRRSPATEALSGRALVGVLALATLTSALTGPGQTIGVSVFVDDLVDDLSLTRSQVSGAYLVGTLTGAALLPAIGRFIDKRGVRLAQIAIGTAFGLALANMSQVNGLIWLAIGFTGIRFLGQGSLSLVATVTVSVAFQKNRGTALGVFTMGSAGLMALAPVGLALLIAEVGWRSAWLVSAVIVSGTVVPIAIWGLRRVPRAYAAPLHPDSTIVASDVSVDRSAAMRTRSFWVLAAVSMSASMLGTALNFHQIDLLGDVGIGEAEAAAFFIPQVLGSTVAALLVGRAADRIGTRYLPALGMVLLVSAHGLAAIVAPGLIAVGYAVVLGAMGGAVRTTTSALLPAWYGTEHLGSIHGALNFFSVASSAVGPVTLSLAEARFGSYPPAVLGLAIIPALALLFSLREIN